MWVLQLHPLCLGNVCQALFPQFVETFVNTFFYGGLAVGAKASSHLTAPCSPLPPDSQLCYHLYTKQEALHPWPQVFPGENILRCQSGTNLHL